MAQASGGRDGRGPRKFIVSVALSPQEDRALREEAERREVSYSGLARFVLDAATRGFTDWDVVDSIGRDLPPRRHTQADREQRYAQTTTMDGN